MRLAGVIYYGQHHFTAQIILSDGQIWFYDGIDTGRSLVYNGSINSNDPPNMPYCRGKQAVAAIYIIFQLYKKMDSYMPCSAMAHKSSGDGDVVTWWGVDGGGKAIRVTMTR